MGTASPSPVSPVLHGEAQSRHKLPVPSEDIAGRLSYFRRISESSSFGHSEGYSPNEACKDRPVLVIELGAALPSPLLLAFLRVLLRPVFCEVDEPFPEL
jgi:hypothetical protein